MFAWMDCRKLRKTARNSVGSSTEFGNEYGWTELKNLALVLKEVSFSPSGGQVLGLSQQTA
jgi:hypothetical protein